MDKIDFSSLDRPHLASYPPGSSFGPRQGGDFELVWMIQGDASLELDGKLLAIPKGSLILRRPGMREHYFWDKKRPTLHGYCHFQLKRPPSGWPPLAKWPLVKTIPEKSLLALLLDALLELESLPEPSLDALLPPLLQALLSAFVLGPSASSDSTRRPAPLQYALQAIERQIYEGRCRPLQLKKLAEQAGVGPEHLCRLFSKHLHQGPIQYYMSRRLEQAAMLLKRSNLSVKEVASASGFDDPLHFSRAFKRRQGLSPAAYRAK